MITVLKNDQEISGSLRFVALQLAVNPSSLSRFINGKTKGGRKLSDVTLIHPQPKEDSQAIEMVSLKDLRKMISKKAMKDPSEV